MSEIEQIKSEPKRYSVDEAFEYCAHITNAHYENFPVASLFLPAEKRPYIQAIYAFSRAADDFADEGKLNPEYRTALLDDWEDKLRRCYEGSADHPVFIALQETVRKNDIPIELLKDLITAFKRDVVQNRYETFEDLLSYCACSANPVGRLVLLIFGYREEELLICSDAICTALQLANFWQDVEVDKMKDRLYLPLDEMKQYGYSIEDWKHSVYNEEFTRLMKFQLERTRELFYSGAELPSLVNNDLQLELKLVWFGGMSILKKIDRVKYNVYAQRPKLTTSNKVMVFLRGLFMNDLSRYGKKKEAWDLTP